MYESGKLDRFWVLETHGSWDKPRIKEAVREVESSEAYTKKLNNLQAEHEYNNERKNSKVQDGIITNNTTDKISKIRKSLEKSNIRTATSMYLSHRSNDRSSK